MARDRAVVNEKNIGDALQSLPRLMLIGADRLIREVSARCDNRKTKFSAEEVMERRGRQQEAQPRIRGSDSAANF